MARFAAVADVAAAVNTTAKSTRKRARCALRRFKRRRGRVREDRRRAGCRRGQGAGRAKRKTHEAENETAVENLAGEFHADNPAIFAFSASRWWLAMRGVDQVVRSGLQNADGYSIWRASDWSHDAAGLVLLA